MTTNQCIVCACGHAFADLRLPDEQLRALYGEHYFAGEPDAWTKRTLK
ncbi:MAG: hypothetical protein ACRD9R_03650 [Pyrinomonadaceae bacterium]